MREHLARAEELAGDSVSAAAARVHAFSARIREIANEVDEGRRLAEVAFAMATELELDELRAHALTTIGMAKNDQKTGSGIADMEQALDIALAIDSPIAGTIVNNLAVYTTNSDVGGLPRTYELYAEAARLAERYSDASNIRFIRGNRVWMDFMLGRWDHALESADAFIAECEAGSPHILEGQVREVRAGLLTARGERDRAVRDQLRSFELSQPQYDPFQRLGALIGTTAIHLEIGELDEARSFAVGIPPIVREIGILSGLTRLTAYADELGIGDDLRDAIAVRAGPEVPVWRRTIELGLAGELAAAADVMETAGASTIEANLRRHAGMVTGATDQLERALAFYRSVDATFYVAQIESALAAAQSESA